MNIFSSPYIVVPFVAWLIAQTIKLILQASHGNFSWKYLYKSGNMPSSHTAIVIALLVVLGFLNGAESPEFGIGAVFSLIVIYDAFGVRRAVGEQGGVLERLIELSRTPKAERESFKIREVLGHTPLEVAAGGLIGLAVSTILMYRHWPPSVQDAFTEMGDLERNIYFGLFGLSVISGIGLFRWLARGTHRRLPTAKKIKRSIRISLIAPGLLGLFFVLLEKESIRFFSTKFWILATALWLMVANITSYYRVWRNSKPALEEEDKHFRQERKSRRNRGGRRKRR
ncbi:MAG TPA: divergent PAP2 family protein [Candidatus Saccharimonadales bacterium]|jgi:hypothetical protein